MIPNQVHQRQRIALSIKIENQIKLKLRKRNKKLIKENKLHMISIKMIQVSRKRSFSKNRKNVSRLY